MSISPLRRSALLIVLSLAAHPAWAQQGGLSRAFELERRGNYPAAADAYRSVLASKPGDPAALLGLERALVPLSRNGEMVREVEAALAASPTNRALYGVAVRAWAAADQPDSVRAIARRWAELAPGDETPYREWGAAALGRRDRTGAREAYSSGRERLQRQDALAPEMAQLAITEGDYSVAAKEWVAAARRIPGYRIPALLTLAEAPAASRPEVLRTLSAEGDLPARRLEAELRARWGDPLGGLHVLQGALPDDRAQAAEALRGLLDQLRLQQARDARLASGRALEALAQLVPPAQGSRLRLDAARAYSSAGDSESARRMLAGLADDRTAPNAVSAGAATTLVSVLIDDGKLDDAARRLRELRGSLPADEYAELNRRIVSGLIRAEELDRADSALGSDSSVTGLALSGQIRLFRGDLRGALERLQAAGPYAGDRIEATHRTALLALLQPMGSDSLPALGQAMLQLERGDTATAVSGLEAVAGDLRPEKGGAELRLFAGRLARQSGRSSDAERLLRAAAMPEAPATAPAAELALAELMLDQHRAQEAVAQLEHLILTYPESALVPQARRTLDEARGAVPKT